MQSDTNAPAERWTRIRKLHMICRNIVNAVALMYVYTRIFSVSPFVIVIFLLHSMNNVLKYSHYSFRLFAEGVMEVYAQLYVWVLLHHDERLYGDIFVCLHAHHPHILASLQRTACIVTFAKISSLGNDDDDDLLRLAHRRRCGLFALTFFSGPEQVVCFCNAQAVSVQVFGFWFWK